MMKDASIINVYDLDPVANVCNQELREIIALANLSIAHVITLPQERTIPHRHTKMHELYYILSGKGMFYRNYECFAIKKWSHIVLPPDTTHFVHNDKQEDLEYLVVAVPPFDPADIIEEREQWNKFHRQIFPEKKKWDTWKLAPDGGIVDELLSQQERETLKMSLASWYLPSYKKARPHHHKTSEEIYYIMSWKGRVAVGSLNMPIKPGDVIYIPTDTAHALANYNAKNLDILCVSTPPYTHEDFFSE